jgi:uncharacterized protein
VGRRAPGVTVVGTGAVHVAPDVLTAVLGAHVRAPDVQDALGRAEDALRSLRAALRTDGVAEPDLRTEAAAVWRDDGRGDAPGAVTVRLSLRAVLRDVSTAGEVVHRALAAAGEAAQLDSLTFGVTDPAAAAAQARAAAFADARSRAEQLATLAGRALGRVESVEEATGAPPAPRPLTRGGAVAMAASLPVEAGDQLVQAAVEVRWAWD